MSRGSLATFMNAMTSADWTMYPLSNGTAKDYLNLLDVYLHPTFFPRLSEDSFKQEGIRFEFEDPKDPNSGLRYKGVVFNELRGASATRQAAVQRAVGRTLLPGLTYSYISGGDPEDIPNLTWEHLKQFHATHYHPSNAYFYTYGNLPLEQTLEVIERNVLSRFQRIDVDTKIPDVKRFTKPTTALEPYAVTPGEDTKRKSQPLLPWVTVPTGDSFHQLAMKLLFTSLEPYYYGGDPYDALNFDADLEHLQKARKEGRFFEDLIRTELLDNTHRALLTIEPDPELEERKRRKELDRLAAVEASLGEQDKQRIVEDALRLKADQEAKQDLKALPTLELSDIPMKFEDVPSRTSSIKQAEIAFFPQPTNGITYLDIRSDFAALSLEPKELLPLLSRVLTQSGAAGQDYVQIAERIAAVTGGVGAAAQIQSLAKQEEYLQSFVLSGRRLDRNAKPFVDLLTGLLVAPELV